MTTLEADTDRRAAKVEHELARLEDDRAKLFRNGQPIYSPPEHQQREGGLLFLFDDAADEETAHAQSVREQAEAEIDAIDNEDKLGLDSMDDDDFAGMNARLPVAERDILHLPLEEIDRRCRSVLAKANKGTMAAYGRAVAWRLADLQRAHLNPTNAPVSVREEMGLLTSLNHKFEEKLRDPKRDQRRKDAEGRRLAAGELIHRVNTAKRKAHGQDEADLAALRQRYGSIA